MKIMELTAIQWCSPSEEPHQYVKNIVNIQKQFKIMYAAYKKKLPKALEDLNRTKS
jgi:hypothetical protein